jgi:hypothetical protein
MIGQTGAETTTLDPRYNVVLRMADWIKSGNAPEIVTGEKMCQRKSLLFIAALLSLNWIPS